MSPASDSHPVGAARGSAAVLTRRAYGNVALLLVAVLLAAMAVASALFKSYDTDEFHTYFGATFAHVFDDVPNNPPLFNLLAASVESVVPAPAAFLIPVVFGLLAAAMTLRVGLRHAVNPLALAAALGLFARGWIHLATYYRAFSLVALFLLLAFDAWDRGRPRQFAAFGLLASLSHHLGCFGGLGMVALSWIIGPRLPWWTLLAFVPGFGIIVWGAAGKLAVRATWGMSVAAVASASFLQIAPAVYLLLGTGMPRATRRLAAWGLSLYLVLVLLSFPVPFREQYSWILMAPITLVWASCLQAAIDLHAAQHPRRVLALVVALAMVGISSATLQLRDQKADHRHVRSITDAIRAHESAGHKLLFYPDSDLLLMHFAFAGFAPLPSYSINMQYDELGPFVRNPGPAPASGPAVTATRQTYTSSTGAVLDVAPLRQPFVIDDSYDCLIVREDYLDLAEIPARYELRERSILFLLFLPVGGSAA